ncbi:ATP-binding protein [Clostridium sp. D2Q-11]|uniref:ATP-binding protein n=1 Tax=Anaeromonas frigoriresistens TaxID=2683708 RepID=A0A942V072_9FIRM|nr:ATP-binding protein [Anaeromonas frigoriresistens]MBS4539491.1 ATP-binding protein [Anaeromonas frigoriresistens]
MSYIIEKSLISDLLDIQEDLKNIQKNLQSLLPDDSLLFDARLILDELICNGIRHGNKEERERLVNLLIEVSEKHLKIEIKDEGEGFKYERDNYDPTALTLGGRGLKIVDGLSDEFYVQDNRVISIKYL